MAQENITHLATANISIEDIHNAFRDDTFITHPDDGGQLLVMGRRARLASITAEITAWVAQQTRTEDAPTDAPAAESTQEPKATEKQVAFIMRLVSEGRHEQGCWYSGPTTWEGAEKMSKSAASTYISALLEA